MSQTIPALICASAVWVICTLAAIYHVPSRPPGEAWVVTASEKNPHHPTLARANVSFKEARMVHSQFEGGSR